MDNSKGSNNMNILNYFSFFFSDKWSVNGALGCVFAFMSNFLVDISTLNAGIGIFTGLIGLAIACLSLYKLHIQVKKEKYEFDKIVEETEKEKAVIFLEAKSSKYHEIKSEKDIKI